MGVNAVAYLENRFPLAKLESLPDVLNRRCPVADAWIWEEHRQRERQEWSFEVPPTAETIDEGSCLVRGAGLSVHLAARHAHIWSPLRWRGFLEYPHLRERLRIVAHGIAIAFEADRMIWVPDYVFHDMKWEAASLDDLRNWLLQAGGAAQSSFEQASAAQPFAAGPEPWFEEPVVQAPAIDCD